MSNESFTYNAASKALTSNAFSMANYTFYGWATSLSDAQAGTRAYTNGQSVSNLTSTQNGIVDLYAIWQYTISYNANGGSGSLSNTTGFYNNTSTLRSNTITKVGYDFAGWATSSARAAAGTVDYANAATGVTGNKSLYAVWTRTVYFINNAGWTNVYAFAYSDVILVKYTSGTPYIHCWNSENGTADNGCEAMTLLPGYSDVYYYLNNSAHYQTFLVATDGSYANKSSDTSLSDDTLYTYSGSGGTLSTSTFTLTDNNGDWPGVAMTDTGSTTANGYKIYKYTTTSFFTQIVFNNGNYNDIEIKTVNLMWENGKYYNFYNHSWQNNSSSNDPVKVVYVANNHSWGSMKIHFWGGTSPSPTTWTGNDMTLVGYYGGNYVLYAYDIGDNNKCIFNNNSGGGGNKTGDVENISSGDVYEITGGWNYTSCNKRIV